MKLSNLLKAVTPISVIGISAEGRAQNAENKNPLPHTLLPDPEICSIHYRAQDVKPGGLFVAISGHAADGHDFIDEALARGASAVVTQKPVYKDSIIIVVKNSRKALAAIAARFYRNPSEKLFMIGITGTNGKTTTSYLIESILSSAGFKIGVIGTINYRYSGKAFKNPVTTPESLDLQRILSEMLKDGITHVVMEISSHAIDLSRTDGCSLDVGVFTNLSQDHLDYHKDMNTYWSCKKRLFTENLSQDSQKNRTLAVINTNDEKGKELLNMLPIYCLSIGNSNDNMIWAQNLQNDLTGIMGRITTPAGVFEFKSPLVGKHNLENILCATGVGVALRLPLESIKSGIEALSSVPGRLEPVLNDMGRFVYVDYAHTPDALENVLSALRAMKSDRIICVFGCGGERDKGKRSQMGEISGRQSDLAIITSDNPRAEDPIKIINQVLDGTKKTSLQAYTPGELKAGFEKKGYVIEPDRRKAIQLGISASQPGDTVLIAGKGHETYQIFRDKIVPFDDRKEAKRALRCDQL